MVVGGGGGGGSGSSEQHNIPYGVSLCGGSWNTDVQNYLCTHSFTSFKYWVWVCSLSTDSEGRTRVADQIRVRWTFALVTSWNRIKSLHNMFYVDVLWYWCVTVTFIRWERKLLHTCSQLSIRIMYKNRIFLVYIYQTGFRTHDSSLRSFCALESELVKLHRIFSPIYETDPPTFSVRWSEEYGLPQSQNQTMNTCICILFVFCFFCF